MDAEAQGRPARMMVKVWFAMLMVPVRAQFAALRVQSAQFVCRRRQCGATTPSLAEQEMGPVFLTSL